MVATKHTGSSIEMSFIEVAVEIVFLSHLEVQ